MLFLKHFRCQCFLGANCLEKTCRTMLWKQMRRRNPDRRSVIVQNLTVGDLFLESLRTKEQTEQARLDFIRTDLDLCLTFATVAETAYSMGHREHAERAIAGAEQGYSTLLRFFSKAKSLTAEIEQELQPKFKELRERLDGLKRLR
jgi:hypothetical protein